MITMLLHAALLSAAPIAASNVQEGWLAFTGCWRAENAPATSLLCFVPRPDGVRMLEIENGVTRETVIVADGRQRPLSSEGCTGFESARWSADHERLFLKTALTCGDRTQRITSGIFAFSTLNQWVSIQAVTVGKQGGAHSTRYFEIDAAQLPAPVAALLPSNRLARETARYAAANPLDFDDVREALGQVEPRAVEVLLIAREQPFDLSGKKLLAFASQGIPDYVIDAMVAVSHPEMFEVRTPTLPTQRSDVDERDFVSRDRFCDSFMYTPWTTSLDRYRCARYGYGYDYFGYRSMQMGGYYSPFGYYNPPVIVIRDRGGSEPETSGGKAGRNGYRRGGSTGTERAQPRDPTPSTSRPASSSGSSGTSGTSSSGSSDSGRTAKPRNN